VAAIEQLFLGVDAKWTKRSAGKVRLRIIGSAALMLQAPYERGTKDSDVLETDELTDETARELRRLAGVGTVLHKRHRMYVDIVPSGLPFLPQAPTCHDLVQLNARLDHLELEILDVVDVVVSKLKRFNANDRDDVAAMVELDLVPHGRLVRRFRDAVDYFSGDARAEDLPKYVGNFHQVERDLLVVQETDIELPNWV